MGTPDPLAARIAAQYLANQTSVVTNDPEALERFKARLTDEMNKSVHGAGKVIHVETEGPGSGWAVVFDTEYAALKAFYVYRNSKPNFGKSPTFHGGYISINR